ncbi:MAG TPA: YceD family protein [Gallionella sp.]|nr:YceD family protein [Gallionella sp.]
MHARSFIDSLDFARNGQKLSGEVPIVELSRLQDALENPSGVLSYTVQGVVDKQGNPALDVCISGSCQLRCQRCLNGLDYAIQIDTRLLLRSQADLDRLDDDVAGGEEEEFDSILADTHLNVLNLLEEEILLSLPIAPKHESGTCQATDSENAREEEQHPFAVLAKLKRN